MFCFRDSLNAMFFRLDRLRFGSDPWSWNEQQGRIVRNKRQLQRLMESHGFSGQVFTVPTVGGFPLLDIEPPAVPASEESEPSELRPPTPAELAAHAPLATSPLANAMWDTATEPPSSEKPFLASTCEGRRKRPLAHGRAQHCSCAVYDQESLRELRLLWAVFNAGLCLFWLSVDLLTGPAHLWLRLAGLINGVAALYYWRRAQGRRPRLRVIS